MRMRALMVNSLSPLFVQTEESQVLNDRYFFRNHKMSTCNTRRSHCACAFALVVRGSLNCDSLIWTILSSTHPELSAQQAELRAKPDFPPVLSGPVAMLRPSPLCLCRAARDGRPHVASVNRTVRPTPPAQGQSTCVLFVSSPQLRANERQIPCLIKLPIVPESTSGCRFG
jgi:hypothetical protein